MTVVQAGSRPWASWADVLFSFVYSRLLQRVRQEVVATGCDSPLLFSGMKELLPSAETAADERISVSDATWADDTTLCTFDRDPEVLLDKAKRVMASTLHQCCKYGLVPNMSKGRSGLLLALRGKGSRDAAAKAFGGDGRTVTVETETGRQFTVQVEASYLHLGGMLSRDADMTHEARRRVSIAAASYAASSKQLLQNKHIERSSRSMLFSSVVTSTFHNLELWTTQEAA